MYVITWNKQAFRDHILCLIEKKKTKLFEHSNAYNQMQYIQRLW